MTRMHPNQTEPSVRDVMQPVVVVTAHTPVRVVVHYMLASRANACAVMDDSQRLIGLITSDDLARAEESPVDTRPNSFTASRIMRMGVATAGEDERLSEVYLRLGLGGGNCAVVVRDGCPVGVIGGNRSRRTRRRRPRIVGSDALVDSVRPAERLINLTARTIVICTPDGEPLAVLPASGRAVHVRHVMIPVRTASIDGASVQLYTERAIADPELPGPRVGVGLVVEREVALAYRDRTDLLFPNGGVLDRSAGTLRIASLATLHEADL